MFSGCYEHVRVFPLDKNNPNMLVTTGYERVFRPPQFRFELAGTGYRFA